MTDLQFHVDPRNAAEDGSELVIQQRIRRDVRKLSPKTRLVAVPNGGQRTAWAGMKAKAEGLTSGFPDLIALAPGGHVAFLEIKARDGRLSDQQIDQLNFLHFAGFAAGCFNNTASVIAFLRDAGFPFLSERAAA